MSDYEDRFWSHVSIGGEDDCWTWGAYVHPNGYGQFRGRNSSMAHRTAYEITKGRIPDGMQIDHLCRTRSCVNPRHLEAVTQRVNLMRGDTIPASNAAATSCPHGHPYSDENTYVTSRGFRQCRRCGRDRKRAQRALGGDAW